MPTRLELKLSDEEIYNRVVINHEKKMDVAKAAGCARNTVDAAISRHRRDLGLPVSNSRGSDSEALESGRIRTSLFVNRSRVDELNDNPPIKLSALSQKRAQRRAEEDMPLSEQFKLKVKPSAYPFRSGEQL
jgi:hypothetical protein